MTRLVSITFILSLAATPAVYADTDSTLVSPVRPIPVQLAAPAPQSVLPANTEIILAMNEDLTTKGGQLEVGTMFYLTVMADVKVGDFVVIPKGSRGAGEVTWKTGKGVFGKSGKMEIELRYVEVKGERIKVEGKYRQEGEGSTIAAVGAAVLYAPLLIITGKSAKIPRGRELSARTLYDVPLNIPSAAVPVAQASAEQSAPVQAPVAEQQSQTPN